MNRTTSVILVIGYGNSLRGDDGVGPYVVDLIAARRWPGVRTLSVPQLTPELTAELAKAGFVIFVDASAAGEPAVAVRAVKPAAADAGMTHTGDPPALLALTQAIYGECPPALLVTVTGDHFEVNDSLSAASEHNARAAVAMIAAWLPAGAQPRRPESL